MQLVDKVWPHMVILDKSSNKIIAVKDVTINEPCFEDHIIDNEPVLPGSITLEIIGQVGDILIGKEVGEGVFGVSFKMKGPPGKIKTTVNPIKTLTPRFITRALEKRKKEKEK